MAFGEKEEKRNVQKETLEIPIQAFMSTLSDGTVHNDKDSPRTKEISKTKELDESISLKKEELSKLLDDWEEWRITEEQYKIKKERIMLL